MNRPCDPSQHFSVGEGLDPPFHLSKTRPAGPLRPAIENHCHCEPARRLVWQSPLNIRKTSRFLIENVLKSRGFPRHQARRPVQSATARRAALSAEQCAHRLGMPPFLTVSAGISSPIQKNSRHTAVLQAAYAGNMRFRSTFPEIPGTSPESVYCQKSARQGKGRLWSYCASQNR